MTTKEKIIELQERLIAGYTDLIARQEKAIELQKTIIAGQNILIALNKNYLMKFNKN